MNLQIAKGEFPSAMLAQIEAGEAALVVELMQRGEVALVVSEGGKLAGYAVFGFDEGGMVTVYAARSFNSFLARAAMLGIFGAAQIIGAPVRVHTEKLRAMARMMGADKALAALDGDGLPMGVFHGV
jgi:hypothetical protein